MDLGSNSFHMVVATAHDGQIGVVDRLRESVRLAAGLTAQQELSEPASERAIDCLARFGQRLAGFPPGSVRAVGTNTLRKARDSDALLSEGARALGHDIEVISGFEEARLIYAGVAHSLADDGARRLVVDIGGGSSEVIAGAGFEPRHLESLYMGCVSATQAHFGDGGITAERFDAAELAARRQAEALVPEYRAYGWRRAMGSSGTIRCIERVVRLAGWSGVGITRPALTQLRSALVAAGTIDGLALRGLSQRRAQILPGGLAILTGLFDVLGIDTMEVADGALREGLLLDLLGRIRHEDVRERTIAAMAARYHVDTAHAQRVRETALALLAQSADGWPMDQAMGARLLGWAAALHEIGLDIAHSHYHKHGAYIARNADMAGFSLQEQCLLAALIRGHRRKLSASVFEELPVGWAGLARRLAVLLRLAVVLHRGRSAYPAEKVALYVLGADHLELSLPPGWQARHPLLAADLDEEANYLAAAGVRLTVG